MNASSSSLLIFLVKTKNHRIWMNYLQYLFYVLTFLPSLFLFSECSLQNIPCPFKSIRRTMGVAIFGSMVINLANTITTYAMKLYGNVRVGEILMVKKYNAAQKWRQAWLASVKCSNPPFACMITTNVWYAAPLHRFNIKSINYKLQLGCISHN